MSSLPLNTSDLAEGGVRAGVWGYQPWLIVYVPPEIWLCPTLTNLMVLNINVWKIPPWYYGLIIALLSYVVDLAGGKDFAIIYCVA